MKMNYDAEEERAIQIREFFREEDAPPVPMSKIIDALEKAEVLRNAAIEAYYLLGRMGKYAGDCRPYEESVKENLRAALEKTI